jgi:hypothetical protein
MADLAPATAPTASAEPETPATFLKALAATLKSLDGVDSDLAAILATHVLVAEPAMDAVAKAKAAIVALAQTRAVPAKQEPADG